MKHYEIKTREEARRPAWILFGSIQSGWRDIFKQCTVRRTPMAEGEQVSLQHTGTVDKLVNRIVDSGRKEFPSTTSDVVFFCDDSFKVMKGSALVPRKTLVRALAMRTTVFMLDEFRTSKMRPGGCGLVIEDVEGDGGYRSCSNVSDAGVALLPENCSLWDGEKGPFVCNRDESATVNMTKCCHARRVRPPTLCRSS